MSNLIIFIITIALGVLIIAATVNYIGDVLTNSRTNAEAAAYINGAQQIAGAIAVNAANGDGIPTDVDELVTNKLLSGIPAVKARSASNEWVIDSTNRLVTLNLADLTKDAGVCERINKNSGATGMDATDGTIAAIGSQIYACVPGASGAPQVFQFKF
jgi:hypothetical protein